MMKTRIAFAFAAALIATPALAADLATKPPAPIGPAWSWAGWYAGVNLGYGMGDPEIARTYLYGPAVCCKPDVSDGGIGLALLYPARE